MTLNVGTPTFMRAPGEATGTFALESAMDELAYALDDRSDRAPAEESRRERSREREAVVEQVAARVLRARRRALRLVAADAAAAVDARRRELVGLGHGDRDVSGAADARVGGRVHASRRHASWCKAASHDLGTGTYTVDDADRGRCARRCRSTRVEFELGDTNLPENPISARLDDRGEHRLGGAHAAMAARRASSCSSR